MNSRPKAIIIGAGFTGCATAHDLELRGFDTFVVERGEVTSGTSGRTHGLLHSGGRYCVNDQEAAIECIDENLILKAIAKQAIEANGGLFVALNDSDLEYSVPFVQGCEACHIPIEQLTPEQALAFEPALNPGVLTAYTVPDATFDPLRLALAFAATAKKNGACFHTYHIVEGILMDGRGNVIGVRIQDRSSGQNRDLYGDIVINATGAWAGQVAAMAGAHVPVIPTPGIMVAYNRRVVQRVLNRLNVPGDGDILLPQRRMAVIGTTSFTVDDPDYIPIDEAQVRLMHERAIELAPAVEHAQQRGVWMSARPLIASGMTGRSLSRTFKCFDHAESDGIGGLVTITGGKATTCRAMAETTSDVVCRKLGVQAECATRQVVLNDYREYYHD